MPGAASRSEAGVCRSCCWPPADGWIAPMPILHPGPVAGAVPYLPLGGRTGTSIPPRDRADAVRELNVDRRPVFRRGVPIVVQFAHPYGSPGVSDLSTTRETGSI